VTRDLAAAITAARTRVVHEPASAEAWGLLGQVLFSNGFSRQAAACFAQAARLAPDEPRWPYYLGRHYLRNDVDQARACLEKAAALCAAVEPDNPGPRFRLAELLLSEGELEAARKELERLSPLVGDHPRWRYDLGLLACRQQRWPQARELLEPLAAFSEARRQACAQLVVVHGRLGEEALAQACERRLAALPPDIDWSDRYDQELAQLVIADPARSPAHGSAPEEVQAALDRLLMLARDEGKDDYQVHLRLGQLLLQKGRLDEADASFRRAVALRPDQARVFCPLLSLVLLRGDEAQRTGKAGARQHYEEAVRLARQAMKLSDQDATVFFQLGRALHALGRPAEALSPLQRAVQLRPDEAELHLRLGEVLAELDRKDEALTRLERAVRCARPDDPAPAQALARYRAKWKSKR
jgi:tetratricopeptide (TPR) repeat protein